MPLFSDSPGTECFDIRQQRFLEDYPAALSQKEE